MQDKWQPPRADLLKVNFDGAFDAAIGRGGWGFVVRDEIGVVRGPGAGSTHQLTSAIQSEAIACGEALVAAEQWGISTLVLESDSSNLVKAMTSNEYDLAPEGVIFRDLRLFISLNFSSVEVVFAPRSCNKVAHELAAIGALGEE
jgi:hypothetical protein